MAKSSSSTNRGRPQGGSSPSSAKLTGKTKAAEASQPESAEGLAAKQQMVEKLFRHTNKFLEENKDDPLLVVEALAAILVRYTALLGPVEQLKDRLTVIERLIGQESAQIQKIAESGAAANWSEKGEDSSPAYCMKAGGGRRRTGASG